MKSLPVHACCHRGSSTLKPHVLRAARGVRARAAGPCQEGAGLPWAGCSRFQPALQRPHRRAQLSPSALLGTWGPRWGNPAWQRGENKHTPTKPTPKTNQTNPRNNPENTRNQRRKDVLSIRQKTDTTDYKLDMAGLQLLATHCGISGLTASMSCHQTPRDHSPYVTTENPISYFGCVMASGPSTLS